jgi:Uma2 family endonuclease
MGELALENYTYEDYLAIDKTTKDEERYELIFGQIYMMSGASRVHQDVVGNIFVLFKELQKKRGCKSVIAPFDIKLECDTAINVVQPDVLLFCEDEKTPCLVVEVLSPSTAKKDKTYKKELYECFGIKNYLIVDPLNRYVDKYILKGEELIYEKCYGDEEDVVYLECLDETLSVKSFFE